MPTTLTRVPDQPPRQSFLDAMREALALGVVVNVRELLTGPGAIEAGVGERWRQYEAFRKGWSSTLPHTFKLEEYARTVAKELSLSDEDTRLEMVKLFGHAGC